MHRVYFFGRVICAPQLCVSLLISTVLKQWQGCFIYLYTFTSKRLIFFSSTAIFFRRLQQSSVEKGGILLLVSLTVTTFPGYLALAECQVPRHCKSGFNCVQAMHTELLAHQISCKNNKNDFKSLGSLKRKRIKLYPRLVKRSKII